MATIVGLDIGTRAVKCAVLTGTAKKYRLADFFVKEIPTVGQEAPPGAAGGELDVPPSLSEVIQSALAERRLSGADVVAAVDAKDAIIREIVVPFTRDEHIRKVILTEAEEHFQTFNIDDVQLEFHKVEELADKSRVVLAAVKNEAIRDRLETLKAAGIDPISLDLDAAALFNAFALTPAFDPEKTALLIDMGATAVKVLLVEKGKLKKIRSIRMGASLAPSRLIAEPVGAEAAAGTAAQGLLPPPDSFSIEARFAEIESALRQLDPSGADAAGQLSAEDEPIAILSDDEFDRVRGGAAWTPGNGEPRNGPGGGAAEEGAAAAPPEAEFNYDRFLERLGIEIQRTFAATLIAGGIDVICLTGGLGQRPEAIRFFTEELDVETIPVDFGDSLAMDLPPEGRADVSRVGTVAVGLALKQMGGDRIGFDFRKNQFRFERRFERMKLPVLCLAVLTFLIFLQSAFTLWNKKVALNDMIGKIRDKEQQAFEAFFGRKNTSDLLLQQAKSQKSTWEQQLGMRGANIPLFIPLDKAVREIGQTIQQTGAQVKVKTFDINLRVDQTAGGKLTYKDSMILLSTQENGLGARLEKLFGGPDLIFSASPSERKDQSGTTDITLKLVPQQRYLESLRK